ncbi:hypothetical protein EN828_25630 [Mesorhizobium sp. M2D.F.Ca.ET.185.01.1.1]|uniref:hypothetical protein n=1 Tax=unclassified Mesorhizobium TaxID=325217 RepID=UPI000FCC0256|nr:MULTISPECIES: hypothetical protein [unclassified Mesorhizobium]TGP74406.1 hypothetical protein EN870_27355 [bacterium M00.F.Ca.ET.227.01.1.1]TGP85092.1 hypothetical protein EN864_27460 [bacterium M00.F.Ca.ET.221.01.1.1]TGP89175.1 hypothetical protein EN865_25885 [bacterium M00.F.Ca.ET.222.01.1.1]TGU12752.1 hypothetical protein EN806_15285 [bacterium M00.F.Ca.ET.163.01.1.1]TGU21330.1 hypothetical protein EN799_54220 [bacterium M00.F.Ca.ET.156.01.1.1]TGU43741.1 hypothetical protein EN789_265
MSRNKLLLVLLGSGLLSGCAADYLNNYDTMTLASGDSLKANQLLQTVDPYNPASNKTKIEGNGARSVGIVQRYKVPPPAPPTTNMTVNVGPASTSTQ